MGMCLLTLQRDHTGPQWDTGYVLGVCRWLKGCYLLIWQHRILIDKCENLIRLCLFYFSPESWQALILNLDLPLFTDNRCLSSRFPVHSGWCSLLLFILFQISATCSLTHCARITLCRSLSFPIISFAFIFNERLSLVTAAFICRHVGTRLFHFVTSVQRYGNSGLLWNNTCHEIIQILDLLFEVKDLYEQFIIGFVAYELFGFIIKQLVLVFSHP